jgi:hypothetical protein
MLAWSAPFGTIPVQGLVAGAGVEDGALNVTFRLKSGGTAFHTETQALQLHGGGFASTLGATGLGVDFSYLSGSAPLTLTVQPEGSPESDPVAIGWAPRAAWALSAGSAQDAERFGGQLPSAYRAAGEIPWSDLVDATIPPWAATGYTAASGVRLVGTELRGDYTAASGVRLVGTELRGDYTGAAPITVSGGAVGLDVAALRTTLSADFVTRTSTGTNDLRLNTQSLGACPGTVPIGTLNFDGVTFRGCTSGGWVAFANNPDGTSQADAARSCKQLFADYPATPSGVYWLGAGGTPYQVYCDMTPGNGGWTLALRASASSSTFNFFSTHWTTSSTLSPNTPFEPDAASDAKFRSFNEIAGTEIRGCHKHSGTGVYGCKAYTLPSSQTLLALFQNTPIGSQETNKGLFFTESDSARAQWITNMGLTLGDTTSGASPGFIRSGINLDDDQSCYHGRVRFGVLVNNETVISSTNDAAGFGASAYGTADCGLAEGPWRVGSGLAAGSSIYARAGAIWVR